jgi:MarR family transcriptional regulator, organic hydroperoxide resistance regulator
VETEMRQNVGFLIWRVAMRWRAAMDRALAPLGLTHAQYSVLAPLYGMSQAGLRPSQRQLADVTGLDAVYVSKLIRALEREGFVARSTSTADPRAVEVSLTEQGLTAARDGVGVAAGIRDRLTRPLGGTEGERTAKLARTLLELLETPGSGD